jgi:hypothetical protein
MYSVYAARLARNAAGIGTIFATSADIVAGIGAVPAVLP